VLCMGVLKRDMDVWVYFGLVGVGGLALGWAR